MVASPTCAGSVSAEAQVTPVQVDDRVEDGVRVVINYDAGIYDGSCALTVTADWANLDTGASGSGDITAVSTIDGHYGFIGYANTTFATGSGTVVVTLVRPRVPKCGSRREVRPRPGSLTVWQGILPSMSVTSTMDAWTDTEPQASRVWRPRSTKRPVSP